jgi:hypothetical protein
MFRFSMCSERMWGFESKGGLCKVCVPHLAVHSSPFYSAGN